MFLHSSNCFNSLCNLDFLSGRTKEVGYVPSYRWAMPTLDSLESLYTLPAMPTQSAQTMNESVQGRE